jgi:hypothetical protein
MGGGNQCFYFGQTFACLQPKNKISTLKQTRKNPMKAHAFTS